MTRFWRSLFAHQAGSLVNTRYDFQLLQRLHGRRAPSWIQFRFIKKVLAPREWLIFASALTVFSLAIIAAFGGVLALAREQGPAQGGEYIEGVVGTPRLINPIFASSNEADLGLVRLVYSGLTRFDGQGNIATDLAENFTVSPDQKTYTFTLLPAKWHDGKAVTARDVVFTVSVIQDKTAGSPLTTAFTGVQATSTDDRTVTFTLLEPYPAFTSALTVGILPEHVWSEIAKDQIRTSELNARPIGSGPFQFKRLVNEGNGFISRVELTSFPEYFRHPAWIENLIFQYYPEFEGEAGALEALRTQKVQGLGFVPTAYRDTAATRHIALENLDLPQYTALFFNLKNQSALSDRDVREALTLAVNKSKILQDTLADEGEVIDSPVLPGFAGYQSPKLGVFDTSAANALLDKKWARLPVEEYKKQLVDAFVREHLVVASSTTSTVAVDRAALEEEAKKLVEAELPPAQVFFRRSKDGKDLVLRLTAADTPEFRLAAPFIAGYWQDIGVRTEITYVNSRDLARTTLKDRDYDVLLTGIILGNEPDQFPFWHSSQVAYPGLNLSGYTNPSVDDTLVKIRITTDLTRLTELSANFQQALIRDLPALFLYSPDYTYGLGKSVRGFAVERITHPADRFTNITDWYVKTRSTFKF